MNKMIAVFFGGVLAGAAGLGAMLHYSDSNGSQFRSQILAPSSPEMASVQRELSTILAKLELVTNGLDTLSYRNYPAPAAQMDNGMSTPEMSAPASMAGGNASREQQQQPVADMGMMTARAVVSAPTPEVAPTAVQVEKYESIKYRLYEAVNNPAVSLSDLVAQGDDLTPSQKKELTDEAMAMIKRGELTERQFLNR